MPRFTDFASEAIKISRAFESPRNALAATFSLAITKPARLGCAFSFGEETGGGGGGGGASGQTGLP